MPITPVTMYQDSAGNLHATVELAEKTEAGLEFLNYDTNLPKDVPQLYNHTSHEILEYLFAHSKVILPLLSNHT